MIETDIAVVGAGPAGAVAALNLAPLHRVLLLDPAPASRVRIGESLAPAARRLFADMRLLAAFEAQAHLPSHGNRAVWGSAARIEADRLRDLDGAGWHLDRARFEHWLRAQAQTRGAAIVAASLHGTPSHAEAGWQFDLRLGDRTLPARARFMVDATGRSAALARSLGIRRRSDDRLVCGWLNIADRAARQTGLTDIESEPEGWWYSAPLPGGRRVIAFHTDGDLPAASDAADPDRLRARLARHGIFRDLLARADLGEAQSGFCAAHGAALEPPTGTAWLAVGDAAVSFDPLAAQGLFNALYTGLAGAHAADRFLAGDAAALGDYAARIGSIRDAYRAHLAAWYGTERRWPASIFWQRRHALSDSPAAASAEPAPQHA